MNPLKTTKIIPFTTSKRIKDLGINLTKEVKVSYNDNYKTMPREMKVKWTCMMDWKTISLI